MATTTVSSRYQVVIPKEIREQLDIQPGQKMQVLAKHGIVHLVPVIPLRDLVGFVKGIDTGDLREKEDRL